MTADRGVIFFIAIACVVICSTGTDIGENNNGLCKRNISFVETQKIYYNVTRKASGLHGWLGYLETHRVFNRTFVKKWEIRYTCCENYKYNKGTCKPQCSSPCTNGYCAHPDICECNPGWSGYMCDVPLLCILNANSTTAMRVPFKKKSGIMTDNLPDELKKIKSCLPECRGRIDSASLTIWQSANTKYYLIPEHSPCNMISAGQTSWKMYTIGGVIMGIIMLLLIVLGTLYVVRRKRKTKNSMNDKPTESIYDDVKSCPNDGYVVPKTRVYDDTIAPPNIVYDEIKPRTCNHYDIVI